MSSLFLFIQKLLKHSKSWIDFFPATAGSEIQISSAFGAKTFAVLGAEKLRFHVENEKGGERFRKIELVPVENKGFRIIGLSVGDIGIKVH